MLTFNFFQSKNKPKVSCKHLANTKDKSLHFVHVTPKNFLNEKEKILENKNKILSLSSQLNYIDTFLDKKIDEHKKLKKESHSLEETRYDKSSFINSKNNDDILIYKPQILSKHSSTKMPTNKNKIGGLNSLPQPTRKLKLKKHSLPNINIVPMSKHLDSKISIVPDKHINKSSTNGRKLTLSESIPKSNYLEQITNEDYINICPLMKQKLPGITIPAKQSEKYVYNNTGLFVFEHPQLQQRSDEDDNTENILDNSQPNFSQKYDDLAELANENNFDHPSEPSIFLDIDREFNPKIFLDR